MLKIATHDSATGEQGKGLLSWIGTIFAKTQSKTIKQQYEYGCRMFDIRVKLINNTWRCAHGLWKSKRLATDIINEINSFEDKCYVLLTYEGGKKKSKEFKEFVKSLKKKYTNIVWGAIAIKYGKDSHLLKVQYEYIQHNPKGWPTAHQGFLPLNGNTWHILIPIPYLWKKIYNDVPEFNDKIYTFVDFL